MRLKSLAILLALSASTTVLAGGKKAPPHPIFDAVAPINAPPDVTSNPWFTPGFDIQLSQFTGQPITYGNDVKLLVTGKEIYPEILERIKNAHETIDFQNYLWRDDESGLAVAHALADAATRGVRVRLIMDWTNAFKHDQAYKIMADAGIENLVYNQAFWGIGDVNKRLHEKLMIMDGSVSLQGGVNMANEYLIDTEKERLWQDLMFEMRGPIVAQMQKRYDYVWNWMATLDFRARMHAAQTYGGAGSVFKQYTIYHDPTPTSSAPAPGASSRAILQHQQPYLYAGQGDVYADMYAGIIDQAKERLILYVPYLAPNPTFFNAIIRAARDRHVDTTLITNSAQTNDMAFILVNAALGHYSKLMKVGVKIYERTESTLHAKAILVDRKALTVGSHNFTHRSFHENGEANVMTDDPQAIARFEQMFNENISSFQQVTPQDLKNRIDSLTEQVGLVVGRWLEDLF
ncbi:MAG TPA: phosphatidylserine/phosphatidylglycerophosphate/cardiolipin synthase family protein [Bdellovibrionota bacterium]|nr:phosphatidylserine/phosphatidylglycerophosphate/cardiolipin synthase family protein [Bdellovibrionota bacterium]